jgi:hypothetical protein
MSVSVQDVLTAREELHRHAPRWLQSAIATGVGDRSTERTSEERSLAVAVPRKRSRGTLHLADRIPPFLDGVPIDVLGPLPSLESTGASSSASQGARSGSDIGGKRGENGTATCVALSVDGRPTLVTTGHILASSDDAFRWALPGKPSIGRGGDSVLELTGADLYGAAAATPGELFQVEMTRVDLKSGLSVSGGLPDGSSFGVQPTADLVEWLANAQVRSYGASSAGWRTGFVRMLFPRRPDAPLTGMCLIQETGILRSRAGDSGSLWVADAENGYVAVGLHWGFVWRSTGSPIYTFITELEAALSHLSIASIVGDASWTATT